MTQLPRLETAIVGLDLSPVSDALAEWLAVLRSVGTRRLLLLHAIPPDKLEHVAGYPVDKLEEELTREAVARLQIYAGKLTEMGFEVEVLQPRVAEPAAALAEEAASRGADYVVVADRGKGLLRRLLLGSTVDELIDLSPKPILIAKGFTRGGVRVAPSPFNPQKPLLAALERDEYLEAVEAYSIAVAAKTRQRLLLVHVLEDPSNRPAAESMLEEAAARARSAGVEAYPLLIGPGRPAKLIVEEAAKSNAGLILLGRGGGGLLRGSVADTVARRAQTHVFVVTRPS